MIIFLFLIFSVGLPILIGKFFKKNMALLIYCVLHFGIFTVYFISNKPTHPHNPISSIPSALISIIISIPAILSSSIMASFTNLSPKEDKKS